MFQAEVAVVLLLLFDAQISRCSFPFWRSLEFPSGKLTQLWKIIEHDHHSKINYKWPIFQ